MRSLAWWLRERLEELATWLLYLLDPEQRRRDEEG
jgi:hypothetical protein